MSEQLSKIVSGLPSLNGAKVLLSGGAGFLGSWMAEALVTMGASVTVIDDFSTGRRKNLSSLEGRHGFRLIEGDVSSVDPSGFNYIVHGASIPSPEDYMRRPVRTALSNISGLMRYLEGMDRDTTLLYMSTSEVYGNPEVVPTPESYYGRVNPVGPRSPYDESKRFGEALAMAYVREMGRKVRIARIHNTYGPRMDPTGAYARAIPKFIRQAILGQPLTVYGDGSQTRSFTYVTDMVRGLVLLMLSDVQGPINIGSEDEITILELAKRIIGIAGSSSTITFMPRLPDDPDRRRPDISRARSLLGWKPTVGLDDGLKVTIEWFRGEMGV